MSGQDELKNAGDPDCTGKDDPGMEGPGKDDPGAGIDSGAAVDSGDRKRPAVATNDPGDAPSALARRLQEGGHEAHADAFRRFYAPLVRYARGFSGSTAAAADIVQDIFLKLWEDRERIEVHVSLQAMLYTMVRNRALNANRRRQRNAPDVPVEEARRRQGEHAPAPSEEAEAEDLRQHIRRWVDELPERRAEAFTLSRDHNLSHQEIAEIMKVTKRTVDTHIYHALRDLRERLDALLEDQRE